MDSQVRKAFLIAKARACKDKRVLAKAVGIAYSSLLGKMNGYDPFSEEQLDRLKEALESGPDSTPS